MRRLLLDTHVWLWLQVTPERISAETLVILADASNELLFSAASSWEIGIKYRLGKLPLPVPPQQYVPDRLRRSGVTPLPVEHSHALGVAGLPEHHRDPFDRLLIVQAREFGVPIVTADRQLEAYDVDVVLT